MNMRLLIPTTALIVTTVLAVTGLMFTPMADGNAGDPWLTGALVLAMAALAAGIGIECLTRDEPDPPAPPRTLGGSATDVSPVPPSQPMRERQDARTSAAALLSAADRLAADTRLAERELAKSADTALTPLRVFFTLRHTTVSDIMAIAFAADGIGPPGSPRPAISRAQGVWPPASPAAIYNTIPADALSSHATMSREALNAWLGRYSGFGEWPIKRPVEMTIGLHVQTPRPTEASRLVRFRRRFDGSGPTEVTNVHRFGDQLFQDNDVSGWQTINGDGQAWSVADLIGATLHVRAAYLSFDDINFQRPPRFHNLHLYFGEQMPCALVFTEAQLAAPVISVDPAPTVHGAFFKTLILEYTIELTAALLSTQLTRLIPAGAAAARADGQANTLADTMHLDLTTGLQLAH